MRKKKINIELKELFMAQADRYRCYYGTIHRETDADGNSVVYGKIKVGDGYIITSAKDQWELGEKLDQLVLMILDYGLHQCPMKTDNNSEILIQLN
jgi:hypothetical protein